MGLVVVKVGGSLYDLPDLRERLRRWVKSADSRVLLVPGGGDGADVIRRFDQVHRIGEEPAHWLALRVLTVNAHFLAGLLATPVVAGPTERSPVAVLDPHAFCQTDEGRSGALPLSWQVTSDAVAARVAEVSKSRLVLLKSADLPNGMTWEAAGAAGLVDATFATVVRRAGLQVDWINLRWSDFRPG